MNTVHHMPALNCASLDSEVFQFSANDFTRGKFTSFQSRCRLNRLMRQNDPKTSKIPTLRQTNIYIYKEHRSLVLGSFAFSKDNVEFALTQ